MHFEGHKYNITVDKDANIAALVEAFKASASIDGTISVFFNGAQLKGTVDLQWLKDVPTPIFFAARGEKQRPQRIRVNNLSGNSSNIPHWLQFFPDSTTVGMLKFDIERLLGIPRPLQRLHYEIAVLKDGNLLADYGISNGSCVSIVAHSGREPGAVLMNSLSSCIKSCVPAMERGLAPERALYVLKSLPFTVAITFDEQVRELAPGAITVKDVSAGAEVPGEILQALGKKEWKWAAYEPLEKGHVYELVVRGSEITCLNNNTLEGTFWRRTFAVRSDPIKLFVFSPHSSDVRVATVALLYDMDDFRKQIYDGPLELMFVLGNEQMKLIQRPEHLALLKDGDTLFCCNHDDRRLVEAQALSFARQLPNQSVALQETPVQPQITYHSHGQESAGTTGFWRMKAKEFESKLEEARNTPELYPLLLRFPGRDETSGKPRIIGAGGFAQVLAGEYDGLPVAVKIAVDSKHGAGLTLRHEIRMMSSLRTPYTPPIYGVSLRDEIETADGEKLGPCIVMKRATHTLLEVIEELTDPLVRYKIIRKIVKAVAALHVRGKVHGDLKPGNVLLHFMGPEGIEGMRHTSKFEVWLCDFGCSKPIPKHELQRPSVSSEFAQERAAQAVGSGAEEEKGEGRGEEEEHERSGTPYSAWNSGLTIHEKKEEYESSVRRGSLCSVHAATVQYLPPENISGNRPSVEPADVYALGLLVLQVLLGEKEMPWEKLSLHELKGVFAGGNNTHTHIDLVPEIQSQHEGKSEDDMDTRDKYLEIVKLMLHRYPEARPKAVSVVQMLRAAELDVLPSGTTTIFWGNAATEADVRALTEHFFWSQKLPKIEALDFDPNVEKALASLPPAAGTKYPCFPTILLRGQGANKRGDIMTVLPDQLPKDWRDIVNALINDLHLPEHCNSSLTAIAPVKYPSLIERQTWANRVVKLERVYSTTRKDVFRPKWKPEGPCVRHTFEINGTRVRDGRPQQKWREGVFNIIKEYSERGTFIPRLDASDMQLHTVYYGVKDLAATVKALSSSEERALLQGDGRHGQGVCFTHDLDYAVRNASCVMDENGDEYSYVLVAHVVVANILPLIDTIYGQCIPPGYDACAAIVTKEISDGQVTGIGGNYRFGSKQDAEATRPKWATELVVRHDGPMFFCAVLKVKKPKQQQ